MNCLIKEIDVTNKVLGAFVVSKGSVYQIIAFVALTAAIVSDSVVEKYTMV